MKEELRDIYMQTDIPRELPGLVEGAIRRGARRAARRRHAIRMRIADNRGLRSVRTHFEHRADLRRRAL